MDNLLPSNAINSFPVTQVSLHRNGIAQIEHKGAVVGPQSFEFAFAADSINDVMKSLVFDSESKENPEIKYDPFANDSVGKSLLSSQPGVNFLSEFLHKLRGVSISITKLNRTTNSTENSQSSNSSQEVRGQVVGIQTGELNSLIPVNPLALKKEDGDKTNENREFLMLYTDAGMINVPLRDIIGIDILSEEIKNKFQGMFFFCFLSFFF